MLTKDVDAMDKILVADDDRNIAMLIADSLTDEGFDVVVVHDGAQALEMVKQQSFSLIMLDIMMPNMDGYEVIKRIRETIKCPIIFVSAKGRTIDTVLGLELGADDYISKPFIVDELVAKVKAHVRRDKRNAENDVSIIEFGEFRISTDSYELTKNGERIELSIREFQLLMYLYKNLNKVLTREQIFDNVWGLDYSDIGSVTVTIKNLRDKIDRDNRYIKTVWGIGYKLCGGSEL